MVSVDLERIKWKFKNLREGEKKGKTTQIS